MCNTHPDLNITYMVRITYMVGMKVWFLENMAMYCSVLIQSHLAMEECSKCLSLFSPKRIKSHRAKCPGLECPLCLQKFNNTKWKRRHKCPPNILRIKNQYNRQINTLKLQLSNCKRRWQISLQKTTRLQTKYRKLKKLFKQDRAVNAILLFYIECIKL